MLDLNLAVYSTRIATLPHNAPEVQQGGSRSSGRLTRDAVPLSGLQPHEPGNRQPFPKGKGMRVARFTKEYIDLMSGHVEPQASQIGTGGKAGKASGSSGRPSAGTLPWLRWGAQGVCLALVLPPADLLSMPTSKHCFGVVRKACCGGTDDEC